MKNILNYLIVTTLLIFVLFSCQQDTPTAATPAGDAPTATPVSESISLNDAQQQIAGIESGAVSLRSMSTVIECSGQIEVPPNYQFSVYAPVNGFIQSVNHLVGDYVKKGTLLTSLTHPDLVRLQRTFLEAYSELDFMKSEFQRKETLAKEDAGSQRAFEQAQAQYNRQQATVNGLAAELDLIGISSKQLKESQQIQSQIRLYAPATGYVTAVNINRGQLVQPTAPLFELIDNQHLHLELQVFAKDLPNIKKGQRIEARLPGNNNSIAATVHLVGKTIDREKKTAHIHAHLADHAPDLAVGTYLPAKIYVEEKEVPAVPITALVREGGDQFIFIKRPDGFAKTEVQTGKQNGDWVELLQWDFPRQTEVVIKGAYYIQKGEE